MTDASRHLLLPAWAALMASLLMSNTQRGRSDRNEGESKTWTHQLAQSSALLGVLFVLMGCKDYWLGDGGRVEADVETPEGAQQGDVVLHYTLRGDSTRTSVHVEYIIERMGSDGRTVNVVRRATQVGGDVTNGLLVSESGNRYSFIWDSEADLKNEEIALEEAMRNDSGVEQDDVSIRVTIRVMPDSVALDYPGHTEEFEVKVPAPGDANAI